MKWQAFAVTSHYQTAIIVGYLRPGRGLRHVRARDSASGMGAISPAQIGSRLRQKGLVLELVRRPGTGLGKHGYGQVRLHRSQMSGVGIGLTYESR
jgi:hypothetical protein